MTFAPYALPAAPASFQPANPATTASTTLVMMGTGATVTYTPTSSGKVLIVVTGGALTLTAIVAGTVGGRYGTGTAPANGAADTGTRFGSAEDIQFRSPGGSPTVEMWSLTDVLMLTRGEKYWFDVALATSVAADHASVTGLSFALAEMD